MQGIDAERDKRNMEADDLSRLKDVEVLFKLERHEIIGTLGYSFEQLHLCIVYVQYFFMYKIS